MTLEAVLSSLALLVAAISAVATIAGLSDTGRARLSKWTKNAASHAGRILQVGLLLGIIVNGCLGIVLFAFDSSPLTRIDVLKPLLFLSNIGFGMWRLNKIVDERLAKRAELEKLLAE